MEKNLQTAFYLNLSSITAGVDGPAGFQTEKENEISFSNEFKLKLKDPVADPFGLALYAEYGIGSSEYELEGKLIIDRKAGNFTLAGNAVFETEFKAESAPGETDWERESKPELYAALAWSAKPGFALSLESAWLNVAEDGELEHSSVFAGPGLSVARENFWVNLSVLPQIVSFTDNSGGPTDLDEFEKFQFRLLFSYEL